MGHLVSIATCHWTCPQPTSSLSFFTWAPSQRHPRPCHSMPLRCTTACELWLSSQPGEEI